MFTCPVCGSHEWGTGGSPNDTAELPAVQLDRVDAPFEGFTSEEPDTAPHYIAYGYCHGGECSFNWPRTLEKDLALGIHPTKPYRSMDRESKK